MAHWYFEVRAVDFSGFVVNDADNVAPTVDAVGTAFEKAVADGCL